MPASCTQIIAKEAPSPLASALHLNTIEIKNLICLKIVLKRGEANVPPHLMVLFL